LLDHAARQLGDQWQADTCEELDLTIALARAQSTVRGMAGGWRAAAARGDAARAAAREVPAVLVAPLPGEPHLLRAVLDAELLWHAGYDVACPYPRTSDDLEAAVAARWFDAVVLSLSPVFRRDQVLARMAHAVAGARRASRNPGLLIVVRGRIFAEDSGAWRRVGADVRCPIARRVVGAVRRGLARSAG